MLIIDSENFPNMATILFGKSIKDPMTLLCTSLPGVHRNQKAGHIHMSNAYNQQYDQIIQISPLEMGQTN